VGGVLINDRILLASLCYVLSNDQTSEFIHLCLLVNPDSEHNTIAYGCLLCCQLLITGIGQIHSASTIIVPIIYTMTYYILICWCNCFCILGIILFPFTTADYKQLCRRVPTSYILPTSSLTTSGFPSLLTPSNFSELSQPFQQTL